MVLEILEALNDMGEPICPCMRIEEDKEEKLRKLYDLSEPYLSSSSRLLLLPLDLYLGMGT